VGVYEGGDGGNMRVNMVGVGGIIEKTYYVFSIIPPSPTIMFSLLFPPPPPSYEVYEGVGGIIEKTYYEGGGGGIIKKKYYVFSIIPPTPTLIYEGDMRVVLVKTYVEPE
jgi:hypothetical protein